jgi:pimeloyl-ACP methyl ester carboxylesterase
MVRRYYEYLDRSGSLAQPLCDAGVPAHVVFGDHEEVGLTDEERSVLEACPQATVEVWAGATHFLITDDPKRVAELIGSVAG